jgi:SCY1-like protein 1
MARLRKYSETMPASALPVQTPVSQTGTPVPAEVAAGSAEPGWAGWAISSFTSKVAETIGQIEPSANGGLIPTSVTVTPDSSRPGTAVANNGQHPTTSQSQYDPFSSRQATGNHKTVQALVAPTVDESWGIDDTATEVDDAWGTMDDDDETFFDASAKPATKPQAKPALPADQKGEPDFAAWLAAKQATTSIKKGPLPKGLATAAKPLAPKVLPSTAKPVARPTSSVPAKSVPSAVAPRVPATTTAVKSATTKPQTAQKVVKPAATKAKDEDDGWGDAWD